MTLSDLEWPFHGSSVPSVQKDMRSDESRYVDATLLRPIAAMLRPSLVLSVYVFQQQLACASANKLCHSSQNTVCHTSYIVYMDCGETW